MDSQTPIIPTVDLPIIPTPDPQTPTTPTPDPQTTDSHTPDTTNSTDIKVANLLNICEECDTRDELVKLVASGKKFVAYNGFEPSGRMHIAQGIITVLNTNTIIENGGTMIIYIADWFAQLNHKMGGDLAKIQDLGQYFIEIFKACGMNMDNTKFIWASEHIALSATYMPLLLDISMSFSLDRVKRCGQIMGRADSDKLSASQIFYPCMQTADIFDLVPGGVDVCQLGVDQRKVNMLAIEYAHKKNLKPPVILSHHMLMSLKGPATKMSKSVAGSAIFMDNTAEEVVKLIMGAYCTDEILDNPIYEYIKYICFRWFGNKLDLCGKTYTNMSDIDNDFPQMNKKCLKLDVAAYINRIIEPVRQHMASADVKDLADRVASYQVTR